MNKLTLKSVNICGTNFSGCETRLPDGQLLYEAGDYNKFFRIRLSEETYNRLKTKGLNIKEARQFNGDVFRYLNIKIPKNKISIKLMLDDVPIFINEECMWVIDYIDIFDINVTIELYRPKILNGTAIAYLTYLEATVTDIESIAALDKVINGELTQEYFDGGLNNESKS